MILNFIKLTWRHFIRYPFFSFINIIGLTVGMTAAMLILLLVFHENSYDTFHEKPENIYRVGLDYKVGNTGFNMAICMTPMGPELQRIYPEVLSYTRISKPRTSTLFSFEEKRFCEDGFIYADSGFFRTFSYPLIQGDPDEVLKQPYSIVLSRETAKKYFGNEDPVGRILRMNNEEDCTITGVAVKPPSNSHLQFTMLASFATHYQGPMARYMDNWLGDINYWTYLRVADGTTSGNLVRMFNESIEHNAGEDIKEKNISVSPRIQNVRDIYLHSDLRGEIGATSSKEYVILFLAIAIFILSIASINYTNLATARSSSRTKEIGIRKTLGATGSTISLMFIGDFLKLVLIANLVAIPAGYSGIKKWLQNFEYHANIAYRIFILALLMSFLVALLTVLYHSVKASRNNPVESLRYE
jgi:putative ABC transport system permease protein